MKNLIDDLCQKTKELRLHILEMIGPEKPGHYGGSGSIAEITSALYFYKMKHDPKNVSMEERDRLIFSKGHAGIAQYAALAMCGYFPIDDLKTLKELGSKLQGHPTYRKVPGIEANTGSLGQGLSIACGMSAGGKLDHSNYKVYCVVGDGEVAEGQIWEACTCARFHKLDNLVVILDCNKLSATGCIADNYDTGPYKEKFEAFGFITYEIDGHNMEQVVAALDWADEKCGKPKVIIANTIKGKGFGIAEGNHNYHMGALSSAQFDEVEQNLVMGGLKK